MLRIPSPPWQHRPLPWIPAAAAPMLLYRLFHPLITVATPLLQGLPVCPSHLGPGIPYQMASSPLSMAWGSTLHARHFCMQRSSAGNGSLAQRSNTVKPRLEERARYKFAISANIAQVRTEGMPGVRDDDEIPSRPDQVPDGSWGSDLDRILSRPKPFAYLLCYGRSSYLADGRSLGMVMPRRTWTGGCLLTKSI